MIAGTPGGLIAAMPPQPTAGTIPGNVLSLHSTTPTGLSPQVAQFNPGEFSYQAICAFTLLLLC